MATLLTTNTMVTLVNKVDIKVHVSSCKVSVISVQCETKLHCYTDTGKNHLYNFQRKFMQWLSNRST